MGHGHGRQCSRYTGPPVWPGYSMGTPLMNSQQAQGPQDQSTLLPEAKFQGLGLAYPEKLVPSVFIVCKALQGAKGNKTFLRHIFRDSVL